MEREYRIILSGGGTGGHIYPAVAVAEALVRRLGTRVKILFVGARGRMEMEKIPALGYDIVGLPVAGLQRRLTFSNFMLPFKVAQSIHLAGMAVRDFGADAVVGFGGYASAPVLWAAQNRGIPTLIQEQNSYAGATNKIVGRRARRICVAYEGMERFFPAAGLASPSSSWLGRVCKQPLLLLRASVPAAARIVMTGNPLRGNFSVPADRGEALRHFGLQEGVPVLLVVGGSLGTRTLNEMMKRWIDTIVAEGRMQVIWQTGKYYALEMDRFMASRSGNAHGEIACTSSRTDRQCGEPGVGGGADSAAGGESGRRVRGIWRGAFIERMDLAYAAADLVISRSGAGAVSELCLAGKPVIFVPSPNVAEDHQTKNAMALVEKDAAAMVPDNRAVEEAIPLAEKLLVDLARMASLAANIKRLAIADSADRVADEILKMLEQDGI